MEDLSRKSGKSKKTIYKYFRNKEQLVRSVVEHFVNEQKEVLTRFNKTAANPILEMASIYQYTANAFSHLKPSIINDLQKHYPDCWQKFLEYKEGFLLNSIIENINTGIKQGLYRDDLNVEIVARYYAFRAEDFRNENMFPPEKFSFSEVLRSIFCYHIRGLASEKGLEVLKNEVELNF